MFALISSLIHSHMRLNTALKLAGHPITSATASMTGGLVTDEQHPTMLPAVPPIATVVISALCMLVRD